MAAQRAVQGCRNSRAIFQAAQKQTAVASWASRNAGQTLGAENAQKADVNQAARGGCSIYPQAGRLPSESSSSVSAETFGCVIAGRNVQSTTWTISSAQKNQIVGSSFSVGCDPNRETGVSGPSVTMLSSILEAILKLLNLNASHVKRLVKQFGNCPLQGFETTSCCNEKQQKLPDAREVN